MVNDARLPPNDNDAEEAVIGSLLINGTSIFQIADFLQPPDFYFEQNQWLFEAAVTLYKRDEAINQVTLAQELSRTGKLESVGGAAKLSYLISVCPTSLDIEHYARIVYRLSIMRQMITAGNRISTIGYESGPDVEESMAKAESVLFKLRRGGGSNDLTHIREVLDKYFEVEQKSDDKPERLPYVPCGFAGLDEFLGGLQRSDLIIVAGRPSMGKTSLALNMARNAAVQSRACVALFSLEMGRDSLVTRLVSSESGINSRRIRFGEHHNEEEERKIMEATGILSEVPIYIDDTPMIRVAEMRAKALRLNYERSIDLVIIDYLQLMQGEATRGGGENRVQEISLISRSLKALARELDAPVIAVSQLSRAVEMRTSHEPQLSDLRESGSIEQDADVVMFIYRDEYYYKNEEEWVTSHPDREFPREEADVIIAKHRNGPTGRVKLRFRQNLAKFESLGSIEQPML
jgi:replicative DNA helicase